MKDTFKYEVVKTKEIKHREVTKESDPESIFKKYPGAKVKQVGSIVSQEEAQSWKDEIQESKKTQEIYVIRCDYDDYSQPVWAGNEKVEALDKMLHYYRRSKEIKENSKIWNELYNERKEEVRSRYTEKELFLIDHRYHSTNKVHFQDFDQQKELYKKYQKELSYEIYSKDNPNSTMSKHYTLYHLNHKTHERYGENLTLQTFDGEEWSYTYSRELFPSLKPKKEIPKLHIEKVSESKENGLIVENVNQDQYVFYIK